MAIETPATIAVLGAGPIGLETALYARFLGYDVKVFERGEVAANVRAWGHVRLFSPFALNRSTLGVAALQAQDSAWPRPDDDLLLTGRQYLESYLLPLSQTDLLAGCIHPHTEVLKVGRAGPLKDDLIGDSSRGDTAFAILVQSHDGAERLEAADIVIDTTGTYGNHRWLGQGGIPAIGERSCASRISYVLPEILGQARETYADRHMLLVGAGYSAATNAVALAELALSHKRTRITWVARSQPEEGAGPIARIHNDRLPERDRIAREANELASAAEGPVEFFAGTTVRAVQSHGQRLVVELEGRHAGTIEVDRVLANVGYRPSTALYEELQVHQCYATEGPMKLAASLMQHSSGDCLDQVAAGAETLVTTEPNFYILGSKSYGRDSKFLISMGLEQIRQLFTIIADRSDLNLYDNVHALIG